MTTPRSRGKNPVLSRIFFTRPPTASVPFAIFAIATQMDYLAQLKHPIVPTTLPYDFGHVTTDC
jgi:hypothetical protein